MTKFQLGPLHHVGLVVPDLEANPEIIVAFNKHPIRPITQGEMLDGAILLGPIFRSYGPKRVAPKAMRITHADLPRPGPRPRCKALMNIKPLPR